MLRDPAALDASPRLVALAGFASLLTDAPWTVDAADVARLQSNAALDDVGLVQVVSIVAMFNHLTRVADATGIELDYESPLPTYEVDMAREPLPRPDPEAWPRPEARLPLSLRPATAEAFAGWRDYVHAPAAGLTDRDRAVLARAAAHHLCDAAGVAAHAEGVPATGREERLAAFAEKLTVSPWRMTEADIESLRAEGMADPTVLRAIAVVGFQNAASRVRFAGVEL